MLTVNCHGLGDSKKRQNVFMYLKAKNYNIYFLQDIHFTKQDENIINHNGVQKSFSAHLSQTQGVLQYLLMIVAILKCSI